jgi:hypothetical protein
MCARSRRAALICRCVAPPSVSAAAINAATSLSDSYHRLAPRPQCLDYLQSLRFRQASTESLLRSVHRHSGSILPGCSRPFLSSGFPPLHLWLSPLVFDTRSAQAMPPSVSALLPLSFHIHLNLGARAFLSNSTTMLISVPLPTVQVVHATLEFLRLDHRLTECAARECSVVP